MHTYFLVIVVRQYLKSNIEHFVVRQYPFGLHLANYALVR